MRSLLLTVLLASPAGAAITSIASQAGGNPGQLQYNNGYVSDGVAGSTVAGQSLGISGEIYAASAAISGLLGAKRVDLAPIGTVWSGDVTDEIYEDEPLVSITNGVNSWQAVYISTGAGAYAGPGILALKTRSTGATGDANTPVVSGDSVFYLEGDGADGTDYEPVASMTFAVDGTPGSNDMPGRIVFGTTADGAKTITERMRINRAGNVGIGTASPSNKLTVSGIADITSQLGVGVVTPQSTLHISAAGGATQMWSNAGAGADAKHWDVGVNNANSMRWRATDDAFANSTTWMDVTRSGYGITSVAFPNGNVGIGTASPQAPLEVSNSASEVARFTRTGSAGGFMQLWSDASHYGRLAYAYSTNALSMGPYGKETALTIDTSGEVGIGVSNPLVKLHVKDTTSNAWAWLDSPTGYGSYLGFAQDETLVASINKLDGENKINVASAAGTKTATFDVQNQRLGVGTASPAATLDVAGTGIKVSSLTVDGYNVLGAWYPWTPTYTGFSVDPTPTYAKYQRIGKTVCVILNTNGNWGTSNANSFTITLPVATAQTIYSPVLPCLNNSVWDACMLQFSGSTASVLRMTGTVWATSGSKDVQINMCYEGS